MLTIDEMVCSTCYEEFDRRQPRCNFCGEPTCLPCRQKGTHFHKDQELVRYAFGLCLPCRKIVQFDAINHNGKIEYSCPDCGFEWTPRAVIGISDPSTMICCF